MAFLQSAPQIYQQMQLEGLAGKWNKRDIYTLLSPLLSAGFQWDLETGTLTQGKGTVQPNTPWVHQREPSCKRCNLDHAILFNTWAIIPPRCLECWKVVVTPKNFSELLELEKLENGMNRPCKCGIELRDYTPKHYGGYFYNNSLDEGRECFELVRDLVSKHISKETGEQVILKRACTEFEMIKGPSLFWHNTREEERIIELVDTYVDAAKSTMGQPELIKNHVRLKWVLWAHANGDMSYQDYNGGKSLFPDYVSYHEGDINDVKADLAVARASAKANILPKQSEEFLKFASEFAAKHELQTTDLSHILGTHESNPLGYMNLMREIPEETKGEHDELT
jgi:hypothetical protein